MQQLVDYCGHDADSDATRFGERQNEATCDVMLLTRPSDLCNQRHFVAIKGSICPMVCTALGGEK
jgi:hypothetical protein